jgi:hypothetical protein
MATGMTARRRSHVIRSMACMGLLLVLADRVEAQQSEDFGLWLGGLANGRLPASLNDDRGSWRLWMDVQARVGDDASSLAQRLLRPGIGYVVGRGWTVWGGYAYIRTDPPYSTSTTTEQRIWQQATWTRSIGSTVLSSRTRLEQRFVSTGSETGSRLREFVKVVRPLGSRSPWSVVVSDEYFLNLNSADFGATAGPDRNRFFVGPSVSLDEAVFVEIGYVNQFTSRATGPDRIDHLIATNLFWNF